MPETRVNRLQQPVTFTTADPEKAEFLKIPVNSAIGDVLRIITNGKGRIIYVGQTEYRGDYVTLEFDIGEPPR